MTTISDAGGGHRWKGAPYSEDEGDWRCGCGAVCDHVRPCSRHPVCDGSYRLHLTAYERDNLLHALYAASGLSRDRSALYVLNNGDWLGQVLNKLEFRTDEQMDWGRPNSSHTQLSTQAKGFI